MENFLYTEARGRVFRRSDCPRHRMQRGSGLAQSAGRERLRSCPLEKAGIGRRKAGRPDSTGRTGTGRRAPSSRPSSGPLQSKPVCIAIPFDSPHSASARPRSSSAYWLRRKKEGGELIPVPGDSRRCVPVCSSDIPCRCSTTCFYKQKRPP